MPRPTKGRDLSRPVTVVNRFTVKGEAEKFEREFLEHAEFLRHQPGFDRYATVRLVNQPECYVHLGYWRNLEAFVDVVHHETFLAHAQRLGSMVETEADQMVNVLRRVADRVVARTEGPGSLLLIDHVVLQDAAEFERRFAQRADHVATRPGFGGVDLLRSTVRPQHYLEVSWWYDTASRHTEVCGGRQFAQQDRLSGLARSTVRPGRQIAYQSANC